MLIKLESGDYINPDRVDGITKCNNGIDIVAIVHFGGRNGFHVTQNDLDKILEWHNKPAITSAGENIKNDNQCEKCKFEFSSDQMMCAFCCGENFQPKD